MQQKNLELFQELDQQVFQFRIKFIFVENIAVQDTKIYSFRLTNEEYMP